MLATQGWQLILVTVGSPSQQLLERKLMGKGTVKRQS
jgi:hypothetical protein